MCDEMEVMVIKLTMEQVMSFFRKVTDVFPKLADDDIAVSYADKLSRFADFVICIDKDEVVGMIAYYMNTPPVCYISFVCVQKEYLHKGLFKRMYAIVERESFLRNFDTIKLEVSRDNLRAMYIYEKLGFKYCSESSRGQYMEKR